MGLVCNIMVQWAFNRDMLGIPNKMANEKHINPFLRVVLLIFAL